ncbi:MAG: glycosyltransferase family 2 protein, partial [Flavobacteriales bacterium]|nr:glycosyltransferase family 2 protein [Flavobacteriales bacterium]
NKWVDQPKVEGLLFDYNHFYGSYDYVGNSRKWYRKEVRIIRPHAGIYSFRDAQGFQKNKRPLRVKPINAKIYHYGWVKPPEKQQAKQENFNKLWHDDQWVKDHVKEADEYDYSNVDSLRKFEGTHPETMKKRIKHKNWDFHFDTHKINMSLKNRILHFLDQSFGLKIGEYKNYRII